MDKEEAPVGPAGGSPNTTGPPPNSNTAFRASSTRSSKDKPTPSTNLSLNTTPDTIDVSHVQLQTTNSPLSALSLRFSVASLKLADTLRIPSPIRPSMSLKSFRSSSSGAYEAVSPSDDSIRKKDTGRRSSVRDFRHSINRRTLLPPYELEETEEIDMGLLDSAAKFGETRTDYAFVKDEEEDRDEHIGYDISSLTFGGGPPLDDEPLKTPLMKSSVFEDNQRMEAQGTLTGGLGVAITPPEIPASALEAQSPELSRRSTRYGRVSRNATVKDLGQSLADKRGEAIKVIMDESNSPPPIDLSSFAGEGSTTYNFTAPNRAPTLVSSKAQPKTEIFYPTANWKPFSMRWPYLTALIIISITLAIAQEYIYQLSARKAASNPPEGLYTFNRPQDLATWSYFSFKYLPTIVAVTFGVLWQFTDNEVKRLEAYYQLSTPQGALAAESINVDYITFINLLRPIRALTFKHYAVFESSLATLLAATLVPPLQAASVLLEPSKSARIKNPDGLKYIHISSVWSRLLTIVLIIIAILGCLLLRRLQTRHSGLMANVHGIAGIAAMANKSHILVDFKDMDTASPSTIHKTLRNHRYELRDSSLRPLENYKISEEEIHKYDEKKFQQSTNPHPLMLRLVAGIPFVVFMGLLLILMPVGLFTGVSGVMEDQAWLITTLAVTVKLVWNSLETDMRMLEPFFILSKRHAPPSVLTMDYTGVAWGWMPIRAFIDGHFLLCLVGIGSILTEILTVCVASFSGVNGNDFVATPNSTSSSNTLNRDAGEETFTSFWVSFGLAITILVYLISISCLVYWRRRHPFLPRQPNTIASVLAFIHQSCMLWDFVDTQKLDHDGMVKMLEGLRVGNGGRGGDGTVDGRWEYGSGGDGDGGEDGKGGGKGKQYGLGWFLGRDGERHCGVDEEELVGEYMHGSDARAAVQLGAVGSWAVW